MIDVFIKYNRAKPLTDKKAKTVPDGFIRIVNESRLKPNELWVDQGTEFYNNIRQNWLHNNNVLMYLTYNKDKSEVAESFMRSFNL